MFCKNLFLIFTSIRFHSPGGAVALQKAHRPREGKLYVGVLESHETVHLYRCL